jgi:hypothetical protein
VLRLRGACFSPFPDFLQLLGVLAASALSSTTATPCGDTIAVCSDLERPEALNFTVGGTRPARVENLRLGYLH